MKPGLYRGLTSLALSSAVLAGGLIVATNASASTTPPWEPDPSSVGTIAFYDANGHQITSGSTDVAPFAAYAVGSAAPRSGDAQAQIQFANPDPSSQPPSWYREEAGLYTHFPLTTGPSTVQSLSHGSPVVAGGSDDQTLDGFESDSVISTTAGYQNVVQVRLRTANAGNQPTSSYDVADLAIDPATHTWQEIYPSVVLASPPGAPTGLSATAGDAAATVSWTAPASDGGSALTGYTLQYSSDGGTTWTGTPHTGTSTSQVVSGLGNGTAYVFRVAA
ncbi:MAG: fibronectin type III domain-containing protein, partial [Actinobacteria bacterium]|nr:fibronectin type III domain-containing protein [Actinomycetota bacterium]